MRGQKLQMPIVDGTVIFFFCMYLLFGVDVNNCRGVVQRFSFAMPVIAFVYIDSCGTGSRRVCL